MSIAERNASYVSSRSFLDGQEVVFEEASQAISDGTEGDFGQWLQEEWETFEGYMVWGEYYDESPAGHESRKVELDGRKYLIADRTKAGGQREVTFKEEGLSAPCAFGGHFLVDKDGVLAEAKFKQRFLNGRRRETFRELTATFGQNGTVNVLYFDGLAQPQPARI